MVHLATRTSSHRSKSSYQAKYATVVPEVLIEPRADRAQAITVGADKAHDAEDFVNELRSMKTSPVAQNTNGRSSAIDGRTTDTPSASASANGSRKPSAG
jgi:hypothetical protein